MSDKEVSGIKMLAVLAGVCVISAAMLGYVYSNTKDRISENRMQVIRESVYNVLPGIDDYEKVSEEPVIYKGMSAGKDTGYAILAEGMGFQGNILLMVGVDLQVRTITGLNILESVETPGLGDKIKGEEFLGQFSPMEIGSSGSVSIDTITGATISSVAVEKIINRLLEHVKRVL